MKDGWFERLKEVTEADGRSLAQLSLDAGLGQNFVQQLLKYRKDPGIAKLTKILGALDESAALYVMLGIPVSPDDMELLSLLTQLSPQAKSDALRFFQHLQAREEQ